jgi:hypothetical protein
VKTLADEFGLSGSDLADQAVADPGYMGPGNAGPIATTRVRNAPPDNAIRALLDPSHSAIFWIGVAAILGLVLVTGQVRVEAALGGRAGRSRRGGS